MSLPGPWPVSVCCLLCVATLTISRAGIGPATGALLGAAAVICGLTVGTERLDRIGDGALTGRDGAAISLKGFVSAPPRRAAGGWRLFVESERGRTIVESGRIPDGLSTGSRIAVTGELRRPPSWFAQYLEGHGVAMVIEATGTERLEGGRSGLTGLIDDIRSRAEAALGYGIADPEAALARGFVLGQDQGIEPPVVDAFRASGLAHLLAVSGQNILLLAILAGPLLAALGAPLRVRLLVIICLIALYVPVAGAGPSIQRAGIMGVAAIAATAAARPAMRTWILALAAAATLALNPLSLLDPGWQLSFVAVAGIMLFAGRLAAVLEESLPGSGSRPTAALAEAIAVTTAAALATLPLVAFHFGQIPATTLAANLVAMPAVAPAMWAGMSAAAVGQIDPFLALPLNLLNAVLLAFIAEVAEVAGGEGAAITLPSLDPVWPLAGTVVVATFLGAILRFPKVLLAVLAAAIVVPVIAMQGAGRRELTAPPAGGLRIEMLDIGQGDSFLLRSGSGRSLLVDVGPPGGGVADAVASAGIGQIDAVLLTHLDLDHVGGLQEVLDRFDVQSVFFQEQDRATREAILRERATGRRLAAGDQLDLQPGRITVMSPPSGIERSADRNARSLVLLVEALGYRTLLTADAESEAVPLSPGSVDILKLAHHGSSDAGLEDLLEKTVPRIGLISAGRDNRYGHPDPSTLAALSRAGVRIFRTDLDGTVSLVFSNRGLAVEKGR